jgi:hypothetical protein
MIKCAVEVAWRSQMEMYTKATGKTIWPMAMAALSIVRVELPMANGSTIYSTALAKKPGSSAKSSSVECMWRGRSKAEVDMSGSTGHSMKEILKTASSVATALTTSLTQKRLTKDTLRKMCLKARARLHSRTDVSIRAILRQDWRMARELWFFKMETSTSVPGRMTCSTGSASTLMLRKNGRSKASGRMASV